MMEMVVFEALPMIRLLYPDLERSEDVIKALSVLTKTYVVLKGNEDVTKALSVLMMDEFKALSVVTRGTY